MNTIRSSSLVTISLPHRMLTASDRAARRRHMNRSEFLRMALRRYLEEIETYETIEVYEQEKKTGKLKILKGTLASLM